MFLHLSYKYIAIQSFSLLLLYVLSLPLSLPPSLSPSPHVHLNSEVCPGEQDRSVYATIFTSHCLLPFMLLHSTFVVLSHSRVDWRQWWLKRFLTHITVCRGNEGQTELRLDTVGNLG